MPGEELDAFVQAHPVPGRCVLLQQEPQASFPPPLRTPLAPPRRRGLPPAPCLLRGRSTGLGADCCSPATPVEAQHRVKDEDAGERRHA